MNTRIWPATAIALLATFGSSQAALAGRARPSEQDGLRALDGEWMYMEDRTEGRALERLGPPMSSVFSLRIEEGAVVLNGHGSGHRDVRVALDGSVTEIADGSKLSRYQGAWKDGAFEYEVEFVREPDAAPGGIGRIRRRFQLTTDGLLVSVTVDPPTGTPSIGLYRHREDIPMPVPAAATMADMAWLAGAWLETKGSSSTEEHWSPPLGGAMLAVSRTVKNDRMVAFEYLRIVERDGGLVYIAQPGGNAPTEFVLSELGATRAVFDNPRHSYPKRIVYELSGEGRLSATVGFAKGGTPRRFEFERWGG